MPNRSQDVTGGGDRLASASAKAREKARELVKKAFARRLYKLMVEKNMTQSEVARRAGVKRGLMSTWYNAVSLPSPLNLANLANVLDVSPEELLPEQDRATAEGPGLAEKPPALSVQSQPDGTIMLRVNRSVKPDTAVEVMKLLAADGTPVDGD